MPEILHWSSTESTQHLKEPQPSIPHPIGDVNSILKDDDLSKTYSSSEDELCDNDCNSTIEADA